jgi:hypothetical protein
LNKRSPIQKVGAFPSLVSPSSGASSTIPVATGIPATPGQASLFLANLLEDGNGIIWYPSADFGRQLFQACADLRIVARRIFDLQIALIAFENGATELWSHDKYFVTVPGLRLVNPLT